MTTKALPSVQFLRECFDYDPASGVLRWRTRPREHFADTRAWASWNARFSGQVAGGVGARGYHDIRIEKTHHYRHRIVWKMAEATEPPVTIDHKDGDQLNDRRDNLREATQPKQAWNTGVRKNNSSGYRGVYLRKDTGKWAMHMMVAGQRLSRSTFATAEEAAAAYEAAARQLHGEFYRQP